jgi:hypothetical protein
MLATHFQIFFTYLLWINFIMETERTWHNQAMHADPARLYALPACFASATMIGASRIVSVGPPGG